MKAEDREHRGQRRVPRGQPERSDRAREPVSARAALGGERRVPPRNEEGVVLLIVLVLALTGRL